MNTEAIIALGVATITVGGGLATVGLTWFLKRFDNRNTTQHAENGAVLASILTATADNTTAISKVQTAFVDHLNFHVNHPTPSQIEASIA